MDCKHRKKLIFRWCCWVFLPLVLLIYEIIYFVIVQAKLLLAASSIITNRHGFLFIAYSASTFPKGLWCATTMIFLSFWNWYYYKLPSTDQGTATSHHHSQYWMASWNVGPITQRQRWKWERPSESGGVTGRVKEIYVRWSAEPEAIQESSKSAPKWVIRFGRS